MEILEKEKKKENITAKPIQVHETIILLYLSLSG